MSIDGVWRVDMLGPYGWEQLSTALFQNGQYFGAGADHHSIGSYTADDGSIKAKICLTQHDQVRTVFGSKKKNVDISIDGKIKKSGKITATAYPPGDAKFSVRMRLTRLADLD